MIEFNCLEIPLLERFLERQKSGFSLRSEIGLDILLRQILQRAYEFVPSESGSILLDDPLSKLPNREENELVFIATFGASSRDLIGHRLGAHHGVVGQVYQSGTPHVSEDVKRDQFFYSEIDTKLGHRTNSLVCVPIYIGKHVCGVLELVNRLDGLAFTKRDMTLLEIFAGYTSFTLQNALDAKRAQDLAKKDDLTGLFNDRWFHVCLTEALINSDLSRTECALIFLDLDNFKVINDRHGHLAGSQVLREVGFLLKRVVDRPGATIARYGGDEFVIVLPATPLQTGAEVAHDVRRAIAETSFVNRDYGYGLAALHLRGTLTASLGVATYDPAVDETDEPIELKKNHLLRRADNAMYRAKSDGKGRVFASEGETLKASPE